MKKLSCVMLLAAAIAVAPLPPVQAQTFEFEDIDAMLENNLLTDAANRYASVLVSSYPERAFRLGFSAAASKLTVRTPQASAQALNALKSVQENLKNVRTEKLSPAKRAERALLENALNNDLLDLERNRIETDPLYYTEAFDALYDVLLADTLSTAQKRAALLARLNALPALAAQAEQNLVQPPTFLSQQAMEKAYYAYLSFDELSAFLQQNEEDEYTLIQLRKDGQTAKKAIKQMFDLFKKLSQEKNEQDFRLGTDLYARVLATRYQVNEKPVKLLKRLEENFRAAQEELAGTLAPFAQEEQQTGEAEVTVVDDLNAQPSVETLAPQKKQKAKKHGFVPPTAQDFYALSKRLARAPENTADLTGFATQLAHQTQTDLVQKGLLPAGQTTFVVRPLPAYYAYTQPYRAGALTAAVPALYLRLPAGNRLAREEQLTQDFNAPTLKVRLAQEGVPGRMYQAAAEKNLSTVRRYYPAAALANGWSAYALDLTREGGALATDEDLLFLAWNHYCLAARALVDARLHTKQYSYTDAIRFLVTENGFAQEEAEELLKGVSARPGEAVSYVWGKDALDNLRSYWQKKWGKKFSPAAFHALVLQAGNVPPALLESETKRLNEKNHTK